MELSAYEILGPIMVGPSSSHTAGACRIAKLAKNIVKDGFTSVEFQLHGSFAYTYKGHGTDRALIGGILGLKPDDANIQNAFELADSKGIKYQFSKIDLGDDYHPNSVKIVFYYADGSHEYVIGSSIGGGTMVIVNINGMDVQFRGIYPTLLLQYQEQKGIIAYVAGILSGNGYSIESINTVKDPLTDVVTLTIEVEKPISEYVKGAIIGAQMFLSAKYVEV